MVTETEPPEAEEKPKRGSVKWPRLTGIQERARIQAEWRINEWHEFQQKLAAEEPGGGNVNALEQIRIGAATGAARGRARSKYITFDDFDKDGKPKRLKVPSNMRQHDVRAVQSRRGSQGPVIPDIEISETERWLLYLMRQVEATDPRAAYAAMVFAVEGSQEAAWDAIGCGDKTFLKYFSCAIATITLLERQKTSGMLDGKWHG